MPQQPTQPAHIKVFWQPGCSSCLRTKEFLTKQGIEYESVNVQDNAQALAYTGETPLPGLPQVPTFAQAGLPGFDIKSWTGFLVPAGTPKAIVDKLSAEVAKILAMPDVKARLEEQGQEPFTQTPAQFTALMSAERVKYADIIRAANIKLD